MKLIVLEILREE